MSSPCHGVDQVVRSVWRQRKIGLAVAAPELQMSPYSPAQLNLVLESLAIGVMKYSST